MVLLFILFHRLSGSCMVKNDHLPAAPRSSFRLLVGRHHTDHNCHNQIVHRYLTSPLSSSSPSLLQIYAFHLPEADCSRFKNFPPKTSIIVLTMVVITTRLGMIRRHLGISITGSWLERSATLRGSGGCSKKPRFWCWCW